MWSSIAEYLPILAACAVAVLAGFLYADNVMLKEFEASAKARIEAYEGENEMLRAQSDSIAARIASDSTRIAQMERSRDSLLARVRSAEDALEGAPEPFSGTDSSLSVAMENEWMERTGRTDTGDTWVSIGRNVAEDYYSLVSWVIPRLRTALDARREQAAADSALIAARESEAELLRGQLSLRTQMLSNTESIASDYENLYQSMSRAYLREKRRGRFKTAGFAVVTGVLVYAALK